MRRLGRMSALRMALLATLCVLIAYLPASRTPLVRALEERFLDLRFSLQPARPPSDEIVLVLIDDASIRDVGRWPWSRRQIAEVIERAAGAGPRTIGIDLLFAEPEGGASPAPGDRALASAIAGAGNVVLPFSFEFGRAAGAAPVPDYVAAAAYRLVLSDGAEARVPEASALLAPIAPIGEAAAGLGHANIGLDPGGAARFEYPALAYAGDLYPSFALELARHYLGLAPEQMAVELGRGVQLGQRFLPTDEAMRLVVNYRRPGHFRTVPVAALLAGEEPDAALAGRMVLIGGAATGVGGIFASPFTPALWGVERHATVIDNILGGDLIRRRHGYVAFDLGLLAAGGLVIGLAAAHAGVLAATATFALVATAWAALAVLAFLRAGVWLDLLLPLLGLGLIFAAVVGYQYVAGARQQRMLRNAFQHYLSPALVEQVVRDPSLLRLGGEEKELTVMFLDLRNSTRIAARLPPATFVELLNEVFAATTRVIFAHDGLVAQYTGDGMLVIFGAPVPRADHALRACKAALGILDALRPVRARWWRPDLPAIEVGIGINTGRMIIGNLGSVDRFEYTVIGEEANLGARLEEANKEFGTHILISEATWLQVRGEIAARELDLIRFRGMERPVRVYELPGSAPPAEERPAATADRPGPPGAI